MRLRGGPATALLLACLGPAHVRCARHTCADRRRQGGTKEGTETIFDCGRADQRRRLLVVNKGFGWGPTPPSADLQGSKTNVLFIATSVYKWIVGPNLVIASAIFIITDDPSNNVATMLGK